MKLLPRALASAALLVPGSVALAQPFEAQGVELLSNLPLSAFGGGSISVPENGNDCWGYVSPSGREYALMALANQLAVVEVTDPRNPVIVQRIAHPSSLWGDVKTFNAYCYVSNEQGGGIQVIDLSQVDTGVVTLVRSVTSNGLSTTHNVVLDPTFPYLFLAGSNAAGSGGSLVAYSLADPSDPVYVGQWVGGYTHDAQVVLWNRPGPYQGRRLAFMANAQAGLAIADVTNPASMPTIGSTSYAGVQYGHQCWLSEDQQYLYFGDELDGPAQGFVYSYTRVFDVSDPTNPTLVGGFSGAASSAIDHNLYVKGRYIYEANYTSGLRVFDRVPDPVNCAEVAYLDSHPENNANTYNGAWSTYPYFPSGTILISDINRGLIVTRLNLDFLSFAFPLGTPTALTPSRRELVTVDVSTNGTAVNPSTVVLDVSVNGGAVESIPMLQTGAQRFQAAIPAQACESTVEYRVKARNTAGTEFSSPATNAAAAGTRTTRASFDMESAAGWVGGQPGDTAVRGQWERGDPEGTAAQPEDDHTPSPGVNCWVTGRAAGTSVGAFDVDDGYTTLLSAQINLAGSHADTRIGYWRWYSNNQGSAPNQDTFRVDISNNDGATWTNAETVGPAGAGTSGGWLYHEFRVADVVPLSAQVRLRFIAEDLAPGSIVEAAVDDLAVLTIDCPPFCPADWNGDGVVDFNDLLGFLNDFNAGSALADLNADGQVDFNDFLEFLNDYNTPC
ncbi:MAG: choice-of-anchor B family protein [Phycisphaerae bacterium]|nr:choice-of-anchor B family protein [Phycisphaerae bacterium]